MSAQLRTMADENCRLTVYDDATGKPIAAGTLVQGNPTIGYGRLLCAPGGLSNAEAVFLFGTDWATAEAGAKTLPCYSRINAVRQGVLTEMVFQMGIADVRKFAKMLEALDANDFDGAADAMLDSRWADETPERAHRLADLMRSTGDA
jgi:lysozyme